jgi:hypothetical protein
MSTIKKFVPTRSEPLWPPAGTPEWPNLPPLPELPPCPIRLGDCRAGDRVLLANGDHADVVYVSPAAVTLRPLTRTERTVFDSRTEREVTFTVRAKSYTVAPSATAQAIQMPAGALDGDARPQVK